MTDIDISTLAAEVRAALQARGIPVLPVVMEYDAEVFVPYPQIGVDDAFDLAKGTGAAFAVMLEGRFDPDELADEDDDEKLPLDIRRAAEAHTGQPDTLYVYWIGGSFKYAFVATPEWRQDLDQQVTAWRTGVEAADAEKRQAELARTRELALELEALPELRSSPLQGRKLLAERLVEGIKREGDGGDVMFFAVRGAVAMIRENAFNAIADLESDVPALVAAVRADPGWQNAFRKPEREAIVAAVLRGLADGYAPTTKLVESVRREAERQERER